MGSITRSLSRLISSARTWIQASAVFLSNLFLLNLPEGRIYQGNLKKFCVPGLNCYSCPAASGACPVGALQAVSGSSKFTISFYVTGFLMMLGVLLGRFVCGFLCPFGWFQELLHKIPSRKFSTKKIKPLRHLKYAVLLIAVIILPAAVVNHTGLGDPYFCKYICPQGVLEGAIPLAAANSSIRAALATLPTWQASTLAALIIPSAPLPPPLCTPPVPDLVIRFSANTYVPRVSWRVRSSCRSNSSIRAALGSLFTWKVCILAAVISSVLFYRPFCKWLCPLGAFYALFNRISLLNMQTDRR